MQEQLSQLRCDSPHLQAFTTPAYRVLNFPFPKPLSFVTLPSRKSDRKEPFLKTAWEEETKPASKRVMEQCRPQSHDSTDSGIGSAAGMLAETSMSRDTHAACTGHDSHTSPMPATTIPWAMTVFPMFGAEDVQESSEYLEYKQRRRDRYKTVARERGEIYQQEIQVRAEERLRHRHMLGTAAFREPGVRNPGGGHALRPAEALRKTSLPVRTCS